MKGSRVSPRTKLNTEPVPSPSELGTTINTSESLADPVVPSETEYSAVGPSPRTTLNSDPVPDPASIGGIQDGTSQLGNPLPPSATSLSSTGKPTIPPFFGDVYGDVFGNLFGNVVGNVTGYLFGTAEIAELALLAIKLQTPRTINGVAFDGSGNITIYDNTKAPTNNPTFTGTVNLPVTTVIGSVDGTELSYLNGVSSNIQAQLDLKAPLNNPIFTGSVNVPSPSLVTDAVNKGYIDTRDTLIALKSNINNPTFTGTVIVPAPSVGGSATTKTYVDNLFSTYVPSIPFATYASPGLVQIGDGLSITDGILRTIPDGPGAISEWFEIVNAGLPTEYLRCKKSLVGDAEIQAFGSGPYTPPFTIGGLIPDMDTTHFLRGDGTWQLVSTGTMHHGSLDQLDYASSGHTGFSPLSNPIFTGDIKDSTSGGKLYLSRSTGELTLPVLYFANITDDGVGDHLYLNQSGGNNLYIKLNGTVRQTIKYDTGELLISGLSIGVSTGLAKIHVGDRSVNNSVDSQILISRNITDSIIGNGHAFSDSSNVNRNGGIGYNSFDSRINITGTYNYDHYAAFQSIPTYASLGTMTNYYGLASGLTINSGTITNSNGLYTADPLGAGTVFNNYGVYIAALTKGTTKNFAIYTAGTTNSYFGGQIGIGVEPSYNLDIEAPVGNLNQAKFGYVTPLYIIGPDDYLGFNLYYNSGWKYGKGSVNQYAGLFGHIMSTGKFLWRTAPQGNADAAAVATNKMSLSNDGVLICAGDIVAYGTP